VAARQMWRCGGRKSWAGDTILRIMAFDLTESEKAALVALLRDTIEYARYPHAPRLAPLRTILEKLEPPPPHHELPPPLKAGDAPHPRRHRR
jgi:hypothetical protein